MLKHIIAIVFVLNLLGCSAINEQLFNPHENVQLSHQKIETLDGLQALAIKKGKSEEITINKESQYLTAFGIDSPVAVYKLSGHYKVLELSVRSYYDARFFAASVLVIDSNGQKIADIPNSEFKYKTSDIFYTYRQEVSKRIFTEKEKADDLYVIVYTTKKDTQGSSVINVWKDRTFEEEAVTIPHATTGRVSVDFNALDQSDTVILSDKNGLDIKVIDYNTQRVEKLFSALRDAIKENNTQKALSLVDQIESL